MLAGKSLVNICNIWDTQASGAPTVLHQASASICKHLHQASGTPTVLNHPIAFRGFSVAVDLKLSARTEHPGSRIGTPQNVALNSRVRQATKTSDLWRQISLDAANIWDPH